MNSGYWNKVYHEKKEEQLSWFQAKPEKSLEMIDELHLPATANIIDIGGGESRLADYLLDRGFSNLTILDISSEALKKIENRLGPQASKIDFITSDVTQFTPQKKYLLWHDRATFHFLTEINQIERYLKIAYDALEVGGHLLISTFSKSGPEKCSGLSVSQYSQDELKALFGRYFSNTKCVEVTHETPWHSKQDFVYCGFKKTV